MDHKDLDQRLQVLEDIEAIKKLKARYCAYNDPDYDADGIASLFTVDGVWEGGDIGRYEGREAIRTFYREVAPKTWTFTVHMVMNPIIEVQGDKATGSWYVLHPCTLAEGNQAAWLAGRYEEEYTKFEGEWKIKHLKVFLFFSTPFDQGWAKEASG